MFGGMHGHRGGGRGWWFGVDPEAIRRDIHEAMYGTHGGRRGHHGGGGGGRGRRMFEGEELRLVMLKLIADEPRHGYDLIRAIEEMTGGAYAPSPGVIYPSLTMLGEMGLIDEEPSEGAKKRFAATDEGRAHLDERAEEVAALIARLTGLGERTKRGDRAPVRRAMGNLRHVLQDRLMRGALDDDQVDEIVAAIDALVRKVEKMA